MFFHSKKGLQIPWFEFQVHVEVLDLGGRPGDLDDAALVRVGAVEEGDDRVAVGVHGLGGLRPGRGAGTF